MTDEPLPPVAPLSGDKEARLESELLGARPDVPELTESRRQFIIEMISLRAVVFAALKVLIIVGTGLLVFGIISWSWHIFGPHEILGKVVRWLDKEEIQHLQSLITSGAIGAFLAACGKAIFKTFDGAK